MNKSNHLTLEQEFSLKSFADLVEKMSREQAQELLIEQHHLMMVRETLYRDLLKQEWNLELDYASSQGKK